MKPLIAQRQMTFHEHGSPATEKTTALGRYMTPKEDAIAQSAKTAIIFAGSNHFMRPVQSHRQATKRQSAIR